MKHKCFKSNSYGNNVDIFIHVVLVICNIDLSEQKGLLKNHWDVGA